MTRVERARARLTKAETAAAAARARSESATPGGLTGYDTAVLSGLRRTPNARQNARRYAAYDAEAAAFQELQAARRELRLAEESERRAARDAITKAAITPEHLRAATQVRDSLGWHRVLRVNAKTVSVQVPPGFDPLRIPHAKIVEVKP